MKRHSMITVFNQLTSSSLIDCDLFRNILDNHFLKFRYFYSLVDGINLSKVDTICCEEKDDHITICITPHENNYINNIVSTLNKNNKKRQGSKYFDTDITENESKIYLDIYLYDSNIKEGELYDANRFI